MLKTQPKTVINFSPNYDNITRLFRDYDNLLNTYAKLKEDNENVELDKTLLPLFYSQLDEEIKPFYTFDISTLISLLQVTHLDIVEEVKKRAEVELTDYDWVKINERIAIARKWLADYADEEEKLVIYFDSIPEIVSELTDDQITYLGQLKETLTTLEKWEGEELKTALFTAMKQLGFKPNVAFPAVYYSFLGKEKGPKAGYLLSYLDKDFVLKRLEEVINK